MAKTWRDYLTVPGGRLYYEVDGDPNAPALTLIHAGVANLRMWDDQVPALASRYRVIRYDTRGFGRTETDDVSFSNRADLAALLDHLGVQRTHLLGLSRGGTIALDFTLEHPERVASLILVGSTPSGFDFESEAMAPVWQRSEDLEKAADWDALIELEVDVWLEGPGQLRGRTGADVREKLTRWGHENYSEGRQWGQPRPLDPPAAGRLAEVRVPVLVAWGDIDEEGVQFGGSHLADGISGARRRVFPGVAHMVNLERPTEFQEMLAEFVASAERD
jgi:pimeloyl-ACP methyl ester carboxylesterase